MNIKFTKKIISAFLIISLITFSFPFASVSVNADNWLIPNQYWYIKNVRSGKYLDVYNANTSEGTNIIQWHFTGNDNQKWHVVDLGKGNYKFVSALNENKVITIEDVQGLNGTNATLRTYDGSVKQKFGILHYSNTTHQLHSGASGYNKCLTVENASCNDGANVFQYQYNGSGNDQWLLEPVTTYNPTYGVNFAYQNYDKNFSFNNNQHLQTYPDLSSPTIGGDCANFVSQCLTAGGIHYRGDWYINKNNNLYLNPAYTNELDHTWVLSSPSPWISASSFYKYWKKNVSFEILTLSDIINGESTDITFKAGDVIQISTKTLLTYNPYHTMYITNAPYGDLKNYKLTARSNNVKDKTLETICLQYAESERNSTYIIFYKFNGYSYS